MRVTAKPTSALLLVLLGSLFVSAQQKESEREELGYRGLVRTVRTETVKYSIMNGKLKAGKRMLSKFERFNRKGIRLENSEFDENGKRNWRDKPILSQGRVIGWQESSNPKEHADKFFYKFDDSGNIIEQNTFDDEGKMDTQSIYTYDSHGRKIQEASWMLHSQKSLNVETYSYDDKDRLKETKSFVKDEKGLTPINLSWGYHRRVLLYENGDKWSGQQDFSPNGEQVASSRVVRNDRGSIIEEFRYDGKGNLRYKLRYDRKYDRRGNWIVTKTFRSQTIDSTYELEEIEYRIITYFATNKPGRR